MNNGIASIADILNDFPNIVGDGKIVLEDEHNTDSKNGPSSEENGLPSKRQRISTHPVDLELEVVLGKMPRKVLSMFLERKLFVLFPVAITRAMQC